jgi:hypothetical protein
MSEKTLMKTDGFEGYEDQVDGTESASRGVIQGAMLRFTNEAKWTTRDDEELPPDLELVAVDIARIVQKWLGEKPVETRILNPGEKFPDIDALNEQAPRSEWTEGPDGKLRGPWQAQHVVYLLNIDTMDRYSFPTGTVGGSIAVRELVDKTKWMRKFRGDQVYPVVALSDTFMNTRFGGRQRPAFIIKRWVGLGGEKALPSIQATLDKFAAGPAEPTAKLPAPPTIEPPSLAEELDDEIPDLAQSGNTSAPKKKKTSAKTKPKNPLAAG